MIERDFARRTSQLSAKYRVTTATPVTEVLSLPETSDSSSSSSSSGAVAASWEINSPSKPRHRRSLSIEQFDATFEGDRSDDEEDDQNHSNWVHTRPPALASTSAPAQLSVEVSAPDTIPVQSSSMPLTEAEDEVPAAVSPVRDDIHQVDKSRRGMTPVAGPDVVLY